MVFSNICKCENYMHVLLTVTNITFSVSSFVLWYCSHVTLHMHVCTIYPSCVYMCVHLCVHLVVYTSWVYEQLLTSHMCIVHVEAQLPLLLYVTRFAKIGLVHTKWQGTLFTTIRLLHQWTNYPCVCHCQWFTGLLFLGLFSRACLTCSSARVVFNWQWCEWTSIHPAGNRHTTGQKAWPSNWLLFVMSRAQRGLR